MISSWGTIVTINGHPMSYYKDKDGYLKCTLTDGHGGHKHFLVHRLVALHFIPNPENKPEVNHLRPHEKEKVYYKYLEWATHRENLNHSMRLKLQKPLTCEKHGMATVTNSKVRVICQLMQNGFSNNDICTYFGFTNENKPAKEKFRGILKHIRSRKTWVMISKDYKF